MPENFSNDSSNQPAATQTGDFVNRNLLRINPTSGIASRSGFSAPNPRVLGGPASAMAAGAAQVTSNAPSFAQKLAALGDIGTAGKSAPNSQDALSRVQQFSKPTPFLNDQGETLPQYRMGIGHRILGTLANFANGFAGNRAQPIYVGPGALNNRYYQAERQRRQNLEAAQQERDAIQGTSNFRDAIDYQTVGKDPTGKGWVGRTFGGKARAIPRPSYFPADDQGDEQNNDEQ